MSEISYVKFNDEKRKEVRIKQDRLKAVINIESMCDIVSDDISDVKMNSISNYVFHEKNKLVIDIISMCGINGLDDYYEDGTITIERHITDNLKCNCLRSDYPSFDNTYDMIYNEFVSVLADYDIEELLTFEVMEYFLKLLKDVGSSLDMIADGLSSFKKIN